MTAPGPIRVLLVVAVSVAAVACSAPPAATAPSSEPAPCAAVYSEQRCAAIDDRVAEQPGIDPTAVVDVLIVPFDAVDENGNIRSLGGAAPLEVRVVMADGTSRDVILGCGGTGNPADPVCTDDPRLAVYVSGGEGYRDVPCQDPDAGLCSTPHPTIDPEAATAAVPIEVDRLDIPIDHDGPHEIRVGEGSLPNGIITESAMQLVDDWPHGLSIADGFVKLEVRSLEPDGLLFDNYYTHGWREGLERIEAVLVFEVTRFEPGAVLSVEDVVVR